MEFLANFTWQEKLNEDDFDDDMSKERCLKHFCVQALGNS